MNPNLAEIQEYLILDFIDDLDQPPFAFLTKSTFF
jgi:hypothetical protein